MKNSILLALVFLITLLGCNTDASKKSTIAKKVRKGIEDQAFKNNAEVNIIAVEVLDFSLTNEKYLDTLKHYEVLSAINRFEEMFDRSKEEIMDEGNKMVKAAVFGLDNPLYKLHKSNMDEKQKNTSSISDSLFYYYDQDSLITESLKRESYKTLYKSNVYIKAQFKKASDTHNILDTLTYVFDQDLKMLAIP